MQTLNEQHCYIRYYPFPEQVQFHADRYKVRHRAVFSGTGGGKTFCGIFEILSVLLENPKAVGYIFEPTYKMVRRILIPTLERKEFFGKPIESNPLVNAFKRGDGLIELVEDQQLWFGGVEEPEYAEGANIDVVMLDEAQYMRHFDETQDIVLRRLRGSGRLNKDIAQSLVTTSPPPLLPGERLFDFYENPETRNPDSQIYRWSMLRNPHTPQKYKDEVVRTHTGSRGKRFVEGLFAPVGTGSFDFDSTIHVLKELPTTHGWIRNVDYGVDFGWTNPAAIVAILYDGDDRAFVVDEFYENRVSDKTLIQEALEMKATWGNGRFFCDRSEPQMIQKMRQVGLNAVADTSKREDGITELGGRFQVQGDGRPRLYVLGKCVKWISEVMTYDADVKENDHAMDATRYGIMGHVGKPTRKPAWKLI